MWRARFTILLVLLVLLPVSSQAGELKVLQFNVGNALLGCPPYLPPIHKLRLHDPSEIDRIRAMIAEVGPEIVLFQEILNGEKQLFDSEHPVLPPHYTGNCSRGVDLGRGLNLGMVCVAWRMDRVQPASAAPCAGYYRGGSGSVLACRLEVDGQVVQAVSVYAPYMLPLDRKSRQQHLEALQKVWGGEGVDLSLPTVMGGDFNHATCTGPVEGEKGNVRCGKRPYPPEFGALFGAHQKGYGRWNPHHTFYGHYQSGKPVSLHSQVVHACGVSLIHSQLDQVFANFGEPRTLECGAASCMPGQAGFRLPSEMLCRTCDHRPIFAGLSW